MLILMRALHVVGCVYVTKAMEEPKEAGWKACRGGLQMSRRVLPNFTVWKEQRSLQTREQHCWKRAQTPAGLVMREVWSGKFPLHFPNKRKKRVKERVRLLLWINIHSLCFFWPVFKPSLLPSHCSFMSQNCFQNNSHRTKDSVLQSLITYLMTDSFSFHLLYNLWYFFFALMLLYSNFILVSSVFQIPETLNWLIPTNENYLKEHSHKWILDLGDASNLNFNWILIYSCCFTVCW